MKPSRNGPGLSKRIPFNLLLSVLYKVQSEHEILAYFCQKASAFYWEAVPESLKTLLIIGAYPMPIYQFNLFN
jgi:hypothetical protein